MEALQRKVKKQKLQNDILSTDIVLVVMDQMNSDSIVAIYSQIEKNNSIRDIFESAKTLEKDCILKKRITIG